jgi:hypothetical protein
MTCNKCTYRTQKYVERSADRIACSNYREKEVE